MKWCRYSKHGSRYFFFFWFLQIWACLLGFDPRMPVESRHRFLRLWRNQSSFTSTLCVVLLRLIIIYSFPHWHTQQSRANHARLKFLNNVPPTLYQKTHFHLVKIGAQNAPNYRREHALSVPEVPMWHLLVTLYTDSALGFMYYASLGAKKY